MRELIPLYDVQTEPPPEWLEEMERKFQEQLAAELEESEKPRVIVIEI